jgi:alanine dehydrogenase
VAAPGVDSANVVILGGGVVGENAAIIATGMRGNVYMRLINLKKRLQELHKQFGDKIIPTEAIKSI